MAWEYSKWNAVVAALNFWTADLKAHTVGSATEELCEHSFTCLQHIHSIRYLMTYYLVPL